VIDLHSPTKCVEQVETCRPLCTIMHLAELCCGIKLCIGCWVRRILWCKMRQKKRDNYNAVLLLVSLYGYKMR
jgi:hypothetical protein